MDEDIEMLEEIENEKKKRPELAKLLSKDKLDKFDLDIMMNDYS